MKKWLYLVFLMCVMVSASACGVEMVDTGHRGVKTHYGKVMDESLEEGLYFYNPISQDLIEMDVRANRYDFPTQTYTKDVQQADIQANVTASLKKDAVHLMYRDYGWQWVEKIMAPAVEGALKTVIGKWDAVDLVSNREKARAEVETMLRESLRDKYVDVIKFEFVNIDYTPAFEKAVERKVVAIQSAIEEQNRTVQIKETAEQKVIAARAEAESMRIRANALSQNKALVEYEAVQKWNGVMPQYVMGNSVPFVNLK